MNESVPEKEANGAYVKPPFGLIVRLPWAGPVTTWAVSEAVGVSTSASLASTPWPGVTVNVCMAGVV